MTYAPSTVSSRRAHIIRSLAAGLLAVLGVFFLGTGVADAATASGTATRAADNSVSGTLIADDLAGSDGTTYFANWNFLNWGSAESSGGQVSIPFEIPAGSAGVPPTDCAIQMLAVSESGSEYSEATAVPITNCGSQTSTTPTTTSSTATTTSASSSTTTSSSSTTPTATTTGTTTPSRTTTTTTLTTTYVAGPGGTGDGSSPNLIWVGLGVVMLACGAGLAVPMLRR